MSLCDGSAIMMILIVVVIFHKMMIFLLMSGNTGTVGVVAVHIKLHKSLNV